MSISREIKVLHLEPTDVCQAACPQCARELDPEFDPSVQHHLTWDMVLKHCDHAAIKKLSKMFMCGDYGDPAAGKHTLDIFQHFRAVNPDIVLGMNTNGGLQSGRWWKKLATILHRELDYVVFSIDGLQDTNHVYRRNVDWNRVIANATTFIDSGGTAHWDMLIYKHNQHQVEQCQQLAKDLGFTWFRAKVSKRALVSGLESPVGWRAPQGEGPIDCHALNEQSFYIDAQGRSHPCCWLGSTQSPIVADFDSVRKSWVGTPHPVCRDNCSKIQERTRFQQQWQHQVQLK